MVIDGGWRTSPSSPFFSADANFEFDFWPIPGDSGKVYALGDGSYQVNATSKHAEDANRVLQFTTTRKFAELFANIVGEIPPYEGHLSISNPLLKDMSSLIANNAYSQSLFNSYELNKGTPSYRELVTEAFKGILNGRLTPNSAAELIQQGLNSWQYVGHQRCQS